METAVDGPAQTHLCAQAIADDDFNAEMARLFRQAAGLLEAQHADGYRVQACLRAADTVEHMTEPASVIYRRAGMPGLVALPTIGRVLGLAIADVVDIGRWRWLDRLQGDIDGENRPQTAEELDETDPTSQELIDVNDEYRRKADRGLLPTIAPHRFNPEHTSWLPILHTSRGDRHYTAMYSNSARAHALGHTNDWVVIYADDHGQGRWTVVNETRGPRAGRQTVLGPTADSVVSQPDR